MSTNLALKLLQIIGTIFMICGFVGCTQDHYSTPIWWLTGGALYAVGRMGLWLSADKKD